MKKKNKRICFRPWFLAIIFNDLPCFRIICINICGFFFVTPLSVLRVIALYVIYTPRFLWHVWRLFKLCTISGRYLLQNTPSDRVPCSFDLSTYSHTVLFIFEDFYIDTLEPCRTLNTRYYYLTYYFSRILYMINQLVFLN